MILMIALVACANVCTWSSMHVLQSTCKIVLTVVLAMAAMDNKVSPRCAVYSGPACTCASMCACVSAFVRVFVRVCV